MDGRVHCIQFRVGRGGIAVYQPDDMDDCFLVCRPDTDHHGIPCDTLLDVYAVLCQITRGEL